MTEQLKTLKDIPEFSGVVASENKGEIYRVELLSREQLKEEAKKWIEELKKFEQHKGSRINCYPDNVCNKCEKYFKAQNQIEWIKYFFNITEEELKEQ